MVTIAHQRVKVRIGVSLAIASAPTKQYWDLASARLTLASDHHISYAGPAQREAL